MNDILTRSLTKFLANMQMHSQQSFHMKNDEEKIVHALHYLSENEKPLDIHYEYKSAEIADAHNENATKNFRSLSLEELVEIYTIAVTYAPPDSIELARSYANRSAALYNGGYYDECLLDIEHAMKLGYPDKLKAKLYARKARCLYGLNMNKMSPDVKAAVADARKWLDKADDENKKMIKKVLGSLQTNFTVKKLFRKMDYSKNIPQIPEGNLKIIGASAAIAIDYSKKFGQHVKAARDIDAGEILLVNKAYTSIMDLKFILKYCWNCSREVMASVPCRQCVNVVFCNEYCRDMAWREHHDMECQVVPAMLKAQMSQTDITPLRFTIKAYKEAGTLELLKEKLAKIDAIKDPISRSFTGNVFDSSKYASIYTLPKTMIVLFEHSLEAAMILYFLGAITEIFGEKITTFQGLLNNQWAIFLGGLILKNILITKVNSSIGYMRDNKGEKIRRGNSVTSSMFLFKHSCDPMAHLYTCGDMNIIIAIQRIKKGEQIFLRCHPSFWEQSTIERRANLQKQLKIFCKCKACVENWGPSTLSTFPSRVLERWPADIENELRCHWKKYGNDYLVYTPNVTDLPSLRSTTIRMMNIYQHAIEYPTQEMFIFKFRLIGLHSSY